MSEAMQEKAREKVAVLRDRLDRPNHMAAAAEALRRLVERSAGNGKALAPNPQAVADYRAELDAIIIGGGGDHGGQATGPAGWSPLARLVSAFRLSNFERDVLVLCAAVEVSPGLLSGLPGLGGGHPTPAMACLLHDEPSWTALAPGAPLHRYRLVVPDSGEFLLHASLRIDEMVFSYLLGATASDPRMRDLVEPVPVPTFLPPTHARLADQVTRLWDAPQGQNLAAGARDPLAAPPPRVVQLAGEDAAASRAIAARAAASLGVELGSMRAADVPAGASDRAGLARLWEREHAMSGAVLLLDLTDEPGERGGERGGDGGARAALQLAEILDAPLVLATREPVLLRRANTVRLEISRLDTGEQMEVWRHALPPGVDCPPEVLEPVASQFRGGWATAEAVGAMLRGTLAPSAPATDTGTALHDACRLASRRQLDALASRISSSVGWDDLVVPAHTAKALREITGQLRHRARVYETWGFAERSDRGLGISALFHGDSGTGKTLAAEVIANELSLDLYRVDLSRVVSKYIGETEKNLRRVFDAAEESGAILLFDEADALFGKRSDVKDSHDRYANVEVSYLLSRMETYRGLAILTTNFKQGLDHAFVRRIRFIIHFPFPDAAQRAAIWNRAFPARTPTRDLSPALLARLAVTGGSIRNIAMSAAFLAAGAEQPVSPAHVLQAAASEYGKLNKSLTDAETRGWP